MISFYPGPSRVHDEIPRYVKDAHSLGIMSVNHRSEDFIRMSKTTVGLLKEKLRIPKSYTVLFTGSATECWEILAQSIITEGSLHLFNGAFGQKWFDYTSRLQPAAQALRFQVNELADVHRINDQKDQLICVTQNETSTGTQVTNALIRKIKKNNPGSLVAVDATSSMAGIYLDFKAADFWYASVQKCFGLPAGLAILVCSPAAVEKAKAINERKHYNSLPFMLDMMDLWQTPFTPNVLGIYLLMRVLEQSKSIDETNAITVQRYEDWKEFLGERKMISHFIQNEKVHSHTVLPVHAEAETMKLIKKEARLNGMLLGEGYGEFKPETFRIANFPALKDKEITVLRKFLKKY